MALQGHHGPLSHPVAGALVEEDRIETLEDDGYDDMESGEEGGSMDSPDWEGDEGAMGKEEASVGMKRSADIGGSTGKESGDGYECYSSMESRLILTS